MKEFTMKITFNLGSISFSAKKEAVVPTQEMLEKHIWPSQGVDVNFSMEASSYTLEAEVGELPAIYKEIMPVLGEIVKTLAILKN